MGASGALRIAFTYPEMFDSVVAFAAGVPSWDELSVRDPGVLQRIWSGDRARFETGHPVNLAARNRAAIRAGLAIKLIVGTRDPLAFAGTQALSARLASLGLSHDLEEIAEATHSLDALVASAGEHALQFSVRRFDGPAQ